MAKLQVLREIGEFLLGNKKYWMLPIVVVLCAAGLLFVLAQGSAIAPFIYTLF